MPTRPTSNPRSPRYSLERQRSCGPNPPDGVGQEAIDRAVDTLQAPYPERILRTFRAAVASSDDPTEQDVYVLRIISDLGLQPYEAPEPLPETTDDDVHLICWLALVPVEAKLSTIG